MTNYWTERFLKTEQRKSKEYIDLLFKRIHEIETLEAAQQFIAETELTPLTSLEVEQLCGPRVDLWAPTEESYRGQ